MKYIVNKKLLNINTIKITGSSVYLIDSPLGTGKTLLTKQYIDANPKIQYVYVSPSISLALGASEVLKSDFYLNTTKKQEGKQQLSICGNSLLKADPDNIDLLILDEPDQIIKMLMGNTIKDFDREDILDGLIKLIKNAKVVICVQHQLSDLIKTFIERANKTSQIKEYVNEYKVWKHLKQPTIIFGRIASFLSVAKREFAIHKEDGKKFTVACSSKKKTKEMAILARDLGLHVLEIHAENAENKPQRNFFKSPTEVSCHYDCIIYSPKVTSGVSITNPDYVTTYGVFSNSSSSLTPSEFIQMLGRNRCLQNLCIWIGNSKIDAETDEDVLTKAVLDLQKIQIKQISNNEITFEKYLFTWIDEVQRAILLIGNKERCNAKDFINKELMFLGTEELQTLEVNKEMRETGKLMNINNKQTRIEDDFKLIDKEPDITPEIFYFLNKKHQASQAEAMRLKRHLCQEGLGILFKDHKEADRIRLFSLYEEDGIHNIVQNWEMSALSKAALTKSLSGFLHNKTYPATMAGTMFIKAEIIKRLLKYVGASYNKGGVVSFTKGHKFNFGNFIKKEQWITKNKNVVNLCGLGGKIVGELNGKVIGLWLKKLGIVTIAKHITTNNRIQRVYEIERLQIGISEIALTRFKNKKTFFSSLKKTLKNQCNYIESKKDLISLAKILGIQSNKANVNFIEENINKILPSAILGLLGAAQLL
jgi:hypothetical protein